MGSPWKSVLVLWFTLAAGAPSAGAQLIDRVVAQVDSEVITWSELRQAVLFNEAVSGAGSTGGAQIVEQTLDGLINRALLTREAHRLRFVEILPGDIDQEQERLRQRLGSAAAERTFLARAGMTVDELRALLGDRLLAERFIEKKIGLLLRVNHAEALSYYEQNAARFGRREFSEVHQEISAALLAQKLDRALAAYLSDLRARADIRVNPIEGSDAVFR